MYFNSWTVSIESKYPGKTGLIVEVDTIRLNSSINFMSLSKSIIYKKEHL